MRFGVRSVMAAFAAFTTLLSGLVVASTGNSWAAGTAILAGFDATSFPGNDDGSTPVDLPFSINFFGQNYSSAYLNNNGNLTFTGSLGTYTPYPLSNQGPAIIAAFFADVDTRVGNTAKYGSGTVDGHQAFGVTWPQVACYNQISSVQNTFQLLLVQRSDIAPGDFDIEFNYGLIQWDAGTASGGDSQCLHGTAARAGYAGGSGATGTYFELPGSGADGAFLDSNPVTGLVHHSYGSTQAGRYVYPIRNGAALVTSGAPATASGVGNGASVRHSTTCPAGDPVNCASGNFFESLTDVLLPERGADLAITRVYNSLQAGTDGAFGHGWSWSLGGHLEMGDDGSVGVLLGDGSAVTAQPTTGGAYDVPTWADSTLARNSDGTWTFVRQQRETYLFDVDGHLTSVADLNGNRTQVAYSQGHPMRVTDAAGRQLAVATDAAGRISQLTDPLGRVTRYAYDAAGDLTASTDALGQVTRFTYDGDHRLLTLTDPRGGVLTNTYDTAGRVTQQVDPAGRTTTFAYSGDSYTAQGGTTTITNPAGVANRQQYVDGALVASTQAVGTPLEATTTYGYDPTSLGVTSTTDPLGYIRTATYDSSGNQLTSTDALGNTTTRTYDDVGDVLSVTLPSGKVTRYAYDSHGNLTAVTDPAGNSSRYSYGSAAHPGDVTSTTDRDGRVTTFTYDAAGNLASASATPSSGITNTVHYTYDADGERVCEASAVASAGGITCPASGGAAVARTTSSGYDALGRLTSVVDANGHRTAYVYDGNGNLASVTDANGHRTGYSYDADDELTTTTQPDGTTLTSTYDSAGNKLTSTDAGGNRTTYAFDARNRLTGVTDPLNHVTSYGYDSAGNRTSLTDALGRTTSYGYDADNRLIAIQYSDGTTPNVAYSYTADGQRASMADGTGTTSYSYDGLDRLIKTVDGSGASVQYAYDRSGNLTQLTYPSGQAVTRTYDGAAQLASLTDWLGHTFTFGYDADGNLTTQNYPNGVAAAAAYDPADQLTSIADRRGSTAVAAYTYTRDAVGQVTGTATSGTATATDSYTYSPLDQLASVNGAAYGYDRAGNPTRLADGTAQVFNAGDQLTTATPASSAASAGTAASTAGQSGVAVDRMASGVAWQPASSITSPTLTTTKRGELLVAFVSADGPGHGHKQTISKVTGGGLTWQRAARSNDGSQTTEVWQAYATGTFRGSITASLGDGRYQSAITVVGYTGAARQLGATGHSGLLRGAPAVSLTTTKAGSQVWAQGTGVGWVPLVLPARGQAVVSLASGLFSARFAWTQKVLAAVPAGTSVTVADVWPTQAQTEMVAVEIPPATGTPTPPAGPVTYTYDANGNRTGLSGSTPVTLTFDQADRLTAYGSGATYAYNGDGLRTAKTVGGTTSGFAWDISGSLPLQLTDGADAYVYGPDGLPLEKIAQGTPTYLLHDQQGSTRLLTDGTGAVVGSYTYDPYGRIAAHTGTATSALLYDGQYTDAESGYQYLRARYYDPATAQFLTRDPFVAATNQPYLYAYGNPTNFTDPTGAFGLTLLGGVIGGVVGGVVGTVTYAATCGTNCSARGYAGAAVGGVVGGAISGACDATTLVLAACGAVGGVAGQVVNDWISGSGYDATDILLAGGLGAAGGAISGRIVQQVGFRPTRLSNLWNPGVNTIRWWQDSAIGSGITGWAQAAFGSSPVC
jgi:RHS repeat-associated protein